MQQSEGWLCQGPRHSIQLNNKTMLQQDLSRTDHQPYVLYTTVSTKPKALSTNNTVTNKSKDRPHSTKQKTHKPIISQMENQANQIRSDRCKKQLHRGYQKHFKSTGSNIRDLKKSIVKQNLENNYKSLEDYDKKIKQKRQELRLVDVETQLMAQLETLKIVELRNMNLQQTYTMRMKQLVNGKQQLESLTEEIERRFKKSQEENKKQKQRLEKESTELTNLKRQLESKELYLEALRKNLKKYEMEIRSALSDLKNSEASPICKTQQTYNPKLNVWKQLLNKNSNTKNPAARQREPSLAQLLYSDITRSQSSNQTFHELNDFL